MVGDATKFLHKVSGPFDLIFQDSDKQLYEPMLDRLVALLRPGGVLLTDNVLWSGEVIPGYVASPKHDVADTEAIAAYNRRLAADTRLFTTFAQVGDGVSMSVKLPIMTVADWLKMAKADAERRGGPELVAALEGLAKATEALRAADWNDSADASENARLGMPRRGPADLPRR